MLDLHGLQLFAGVRAIFCAGDHPGDLQFFAGWGT